MAIATVNVMVKDRLPYLSDASNDAFIERKRVEEVWKMQSQSGKDNASVEDESGYTPIQNMLFAAMIAYYVVQAKVVQTLAGNGTAGSTGGAKILKRAKADVVEAEFMITTAADGSLIQMTTSDLMALLQKEVCELSQLLNWANPICQYKFDVIPAFVMASDFPPRPSLDDCIPNGTFPRSI